MILAVKITPGSKIQSLQISNNFVKISLKSQPIDGKANEELIGFLAKKFSIPKSNITIKSGFRGKNKLINIEKLTEEQFYKIMKSDK